MRIRPSHLPTLLASFTFVVLTAASVMSCQAQTAVLSEIYGRGVHAYNSGQYDRATELMSMAIDNGFKDPRAYYFRGLATAASGRGYDATGDFELGAELEARGAFGNSIGRALARVQGSTRLELEKIREHAQLRALAANQARSQARYGELGASATGGAVAAQPAAPQPAAPQAAAPAQPRAVTPPAAPSTVDPFADDMDNDPVVESADVLKGAVENAITEEDAASPAEAGDAAGGASPFDAPGGSDPFAAPAGGNDPFAPAAGDDDDPFGF